MPQDDDRKYASTPMGEMFKPIGQMFTALARNTNKAFWRMNDALNGGTTVDGYERDTPPKKDTRSGPK